MFVKTGAPANAVLRIQNKQMPTGIVEVGLMSAINQARFPDRAILEIDSTPQPLHFMQQTQVAGAILVPPAKRGRSASLGRCE
jgi:hypothetical protein